MHVLTRYFPGALTLALLGSLALCPPMARAADEQPGPAPAAPAAPAMGSPIVLAVPPGLTLEDVKVAVLEAVFGRKLQVLDQGEGRIVGYHGRGNISLSLTITWQTDQVSIEVRQWDSREKARRRQEGWLENVRKDITAALAKKKTLK